MEPVCWFCRKGRHRDCMGEVPVGDGSEGPHDCSFGTRMAECACAECRPDPASPEVSENP